MVEASAVGNHRLVKSMLPPLSLADLLNGRTARSDLKNFSGCHDRRGAPISSRATALTLLGCGAPGSQDADGDKRRHFIDLSLQ